ncbi:hypothetical protein pb186bvf_012646 [Paramecium bursaria]
MMFYYWGSTPTQTDSSVPKQFNVPLQVNKFACGEEHLIMLSGGTLKGWVPIIMELQEMEVMTMDIKHMSDFDCGWNHTIAIQAGQAFYWGRGQPDILRPKIIASLIKYVSCGARHSMIINTQNQLFSFGANDVGQCGIAHIKRITEPLHIMDNVSQVACGVTHKLILTNDQLLVVGLTVYNNWEFKESNKLQKPQLIDLKNVTAIATGNPTAAISNSQLFIWGLPTVFLTEIVEVQIRGSCGYAIDQNQYLFSWGTNVNGELGLGDQNSRNQPNKVKNMPVTTEKDYLTKTLQIESEERNTLEKINRDIKQRLCDVESQNTEFRKAIQGRDEELNKLHQRVGLLSQDLLGSEGHVKDLRQQCLRFQNLQRDAAQKLQNYEDLMKVLEGKLQLKEQENYQEDEDQQLHEFKSQIQEMTEQLQYEQEVNNQITQQLNKEREANVHHKQINQQYEFEFANLTSQNRQLTSQEQNQLNQHHKLSEALTLSNHRIESLQTQNAKLMQELSFHKFLKNISCFRIEKQLTDLNLQLQNQIRLKDQELFRFKSQGISRQSSQKSIIQEKVNQSPSG